MRIWCRVWLIAVSIVACATATEAQQAESTDECARWLVAATRAYDLGIFDGVLLNNGCLERGNRAQKVASHELRAKAFVAEIRYDDARREIRSLLRHDPDFEAQPRDHPLFIQMLSEERRSLVSSISSSRRTGARLPPRWLSLRRRKSPGEATWISEAVLHDLPGFDISRGNGDVYSNIYQRGYRSSATDRTLLLVDGIEQNSLHSNIAYLSRQYPLSNIERVEVVYGPASMVYGPNAFSGVINVITTQPYDLADEGQSLAGRLQAGYGGSSTSHVDGTFGGSTDAFSWSLTARGFRSDEQDLSAYGELGRSLEFAGSAEFPRVFVEADYDRVMVLEQEILQKYICAQGAEKELPIFESLSESTRRQKWP